MAIGKGLELLFEKTGYFFSDPTLAENALTHSSYSNEYKSRGLSIPSNERLEFLGDSVLEIVISEYLYDLDSRLSEGKLTRIRQSLVCEKTLAKIAASISLGEYLHLGNGEESDCRTRPKVLADALEAYFGAAYLDSRAKGSDEYKSLILGLFSSEIASSIASGGQDNKTVLQQLAEKDGSILEYVITDESGPEHKKQFTVVAKIDNNVVGEGTAFSKKDAEMLAAEKALQLFGILPQVKNEE